MAARQILEQLGERSAAIERRRHLLRIEARKLEENVGAHGKNRGTHVLRILIEELIRRDDRDSEFAGFAQDRIETAPVGHEVLDFIAIEREELAPRTGEQRVLDRREEQASERGCLFPQPPFVKIENDPASMVDGVEH